MNCSVGTPQAFDDSQAYGYKMLSQFKKITPLLNRIVIKRIEAPKQTAGGIYLPESKDDDMQVGEVISCGPGGYDDHGNFTPVTLQPGQTVLLPSYGGMKIDFQDVKYSIYKDSEILAVLE